MFLDLVSALLISKLDENNFDWNKTFKESDTDKNNNEVVDLFPKKILAIFQKHPNAKLLLDDEDFSQVKNLADYRNTILDFQKFMQEIRSSISAEAKNKFFTFSAADKDKLFKFNDSFECSKDNCEGLPEKTKMFSYETMPFYFLIADVKGQLKIVKILPPSG